MLPSFDIFGFTVGVYGLCSVVGLLLCGLVGSRMIKRFGIDFYDFILIMLSVALGLVIGAHIVYGITRIDLFVTAVSHIGKLSFVRFFEIMGIVFGGMVFYGGFLGGLAAIPIYCKFNKKYRARDILDIYAVLVPLFHVFGRIGCFFGGCCYGIESHFGFTVHGNTVNPDINDVNRLPVPLIEAVCNLLIFLLLLYLFKKKYMGGKLILIYMLVYPVVRFTMEFFRGDTIRGFFLGLSTSQWISILLFTTSVVILIVNKFKQSKTLKTE